ncbi:MAG: hypothetical protein U5P10_17320 [Spirochaetia bacterium]|nr:hypothetical protein [Spirochaetia bacterium]
MSALWLSAAGYAQQQSLWAPVYPGAVQCEYSSGDNVSVFFSHDTYDRLEAFYSADKDIKPRKSEKDDARSAFFIYSKSVYGDAGSIDGVSINYDHAYSPAVGTVFKRLEQLILDGALDRQEFAEIRRRYERMGRYFELSDQRDKRGYHVPMDKDNFAAVRTADRRLYPGGRELGGERRRFNDPLPLFNSPGKVSGGCGVDAKGLCPELRGGPATDRQKSGRIVEGVSVGDGVGGLSRSA